MFLALFSLLSYVFHQELDQGIRVSGIWLNSGTPSLKQGVLQQWCSTKVCVQLWCTQSMELGVKELGNLVFLVLSFVSPKSLWAKELGVFFKSQLRTENKELRSQRIWFSFVFLRCS